MTNARPRIRLLVALVALPLVVWAPPARAAAATPVPAAAESLLARAGRQSAAGRPRAALALRDSAVAMLEACGCAPPLVLAGAHAARAHSATVERRYDLAAADLDRALALAGGGDTAAVRVRCRVLSLQSALLGARGRFEDAVARGDEAVALARTLPVTGAELVDALSNRAVAQSRLSRSADALASQREAVALAERVHGPGTREVAFELLRLAEVQLEARDLAGHVESARRADSVFARTTRPNHPSRGSTQRSLARGLLRLGRFAEARACLDSALAVARANAGPDSAELATPLGAIADLAEAQHDTLAVVATLRRLVEIYRNAYGPEHPYALSSELRIAAFASPADSAAALATFRRALPLLERSVGTQSVYAQEYRRDFAWKLLLAGHAREAFEQGRLSEEGRRAQLLASIRSLSEREAVTLAGGRYGGLFLALLAAQRAGDPALAAEAFDLVVRWRALVVDELASRRRTFGSGDPHLLPLETELGESSRELARLVLAGAGSDSVAVHQRRLAAAFARRDAAERALAAASERFRHEQARRELGAADVLAARPPGAALVSFVRIATPGGLGDLNRYLALVVPAGGERVQVVTLGGAIPLEKAVDDWHDALADPASGEAWHAAGAALRERLWAPLAPLLGEARELLVVPDGKLNRVPFALLPDSAGRLLGVDGPLVRTLACERDLAEREGARAGSGLLLVGGPDFAAPGTNEPLAVALPVTRSACAGAAELSFAPLAGAAAEVHDVAAAWRAGEPREPVREFTGAAATEAAFKREAPRARWLHVATHGFFLDENCRELPGTRGVGGLAPAAAPAPRAVAPAVRFESPLRRAGLALAGANGWAAAAAGTEDGVLAADEITALDLGGVQGAVLSACDTGAGDFLPGEGVFGLARAFRIAGVRSLVTSLWAVDDAAAREWMSRFYAALARGDDAASAVRTAARAVRDSRAARGASTHPFWWGAFVATGR